MKLSDFFCQIQLEQLRQAETEVRWENEEDVDECHNCKQPFTVTKRKVSHEYLSIWCENTVEVIQWI